MLSGSDTPGSASLSWCHIMQGRHQAMWSKVETPLSLMETHLIFQVSNGTSAVVFPLLVCPAPRDSIYFVLELLYTSMWSTSSEGQITLTLLCEYCHHKVQTVTNTRAGHIKTVQWKLSLKYNGFILVLICWIWKCSKALKMQFTVIAWNYCWLKKNTICQKKQKNLIGYNY